MVSKQTKINTDEPYLQGGNKDSENGFVDRVDLEYISYFVRGNSLVYACEIIIKQVNVAHDFRTTGLV